MKDVTEYCLHNNPMENNNICVKVRMQKSAFIDPKGISEQ